VASWRGLSRGSHPDATRVVVVLFLVGVDDW